MSKSSQRYSMPRDDRGLLSTGKKSITSARKSIQRLPLQEKSEEAKMRTMKRDGRYSMPKGERNIDLTKFSAQHS